MELIQPNIANLFEQMSMLGKIEQGVPIEFPSLHGGTIAGRHPIIIHNDKRNRLSQEELSVVFFFRIAN
jgi:hypothetical protein